MTEEGNIIEAEGIFYKLRVGATIKNLETGIRVEIERFERVGMEDKTLELTLQQGQDMVKCGFVSIFGGYKECDSNKVKARDFEYSVKSLLHQMKSMIKRGFISIFGGKERYDSNEGRVTSLEYFARTLSGEWDYENHPPREFIICPAREICLKRREHRVCVRPCVYLALKLSLLIEEMKEVKGG